MPLHGIYLSQTLFELVLLFFEFFTISKIATPERVAILLNKARFTLYSELMVQFIMFVLGNPVDFPIYHMNFIYCIFAWEK